MDVLHFFEAMSESLDVFVWLLIEDIGKNEAQIKSVRIYSRRDC